MRPQEPGTSAELAGDAEQALGEAPAGLRGALPGEQLDLRPQGGPSAFEDRHLVEGTGAPRRGVLVQALPEGGLVIAAGWSAFSGRSEWQAWLADRSSRRRGPGAVRHELRR